jgi:hypothetical protein
VRSRRVRERNIRLAWEDLTGAEGFKDFNTVSEAREHIDPSWKDWVIFEIDYPFYQARGRVLDQSDLSRPSSEFLWDKLLG